jgi:hypothetical protein
MKIYLSYAQWFISDISELSIEQFFEKKRREKGNNYSSDLYRNMVIDVQGNVTNISGTRLDFKKKYIDGKLKSINETETKINEVLINKPLNIKRLK